jgi:hypothetical protein
MKTRWGITARMRPVLPLCAVFLAGCFCAGICFFTWGSQAIGELDRRYALEHGRTTGLIDRLTEELGREREINRDLRANNRRAREITQGLADSAEQNVRNLQEAVGLIGEIRKKLQILENFYADNGSSGGNS